MAVITPAQVVQALLQAQQELGVKLTRDEMIGLTAIPSRESGYNTNAHNPNRATGDDSYGLWQINMLGDMGVSRAKALGITDYTQLYDPVISAKAAIQLVLAGRKKGDPLNAWGGYKGMSDTYNVGSGALQAAQQAVDAAGAGGDQTGQSYGSDLPGLAGTTGSTTGQTQAGAVNSTSPLQTARPVTDQEVNAYIRDNYGYLVAYLNDPELGPILRDAAKQGLSKDLLYGKLSQTQWWKTTSDTNRLWQQLKNEDPASAAGRLAAQRVKIINMIGKAGIALDSGTLGQLTESSLQFGWNDDQITDAILAYAKPGAMGYTQGDLGAYQNQVQQLYAQYLLPVDTATAADQAKRIASGELTLDGVKANAQTQAKGMFANNQDMINLINQGITPADQLSLQRQTIANTLEMDPNDVDFVNNPQFRQVLDTIDPTTGKHRIMSVAEADDLAKNQPQYKNTVGARRAFLDAGAQMKQIMGIN